MVSLNVFTYTSLFMAQRSSTAPQTTFFKTLVKLNEHLSFRIRSTL